MDARVILSFRTQETDGALPPELRDADTIVPVLTSLAPIEKTQPVSLIIPTFFNTMLKRYSLQHLLAGLERSESVQEIILAVSDGEPGDYEFVRPLIGAKRLAVVACDPNNRARSRNQAAAAAGGGMLLFLDDDMIVKDWSSMDAILSKLLSDRFDCALFPRRHYARFPLLYDARKLKGVVATWRTGEISPADPFLYDPIRDRSRSKTLFFCYPGCFMMIDRAAFFELGGFAEQFMGWGFEDADFALRACHRLKVLNLFRKSEPLLHIDHPVSPYKSEEYLCNHDRFLQTFSTTDFEILCSRVFSGEDFSEHRWPAPDDPSYLRPLIEAKASYPLPIDLEQLAPGYLRVAKARHSQGLVPLPEQIVIHGSRGRDTARSDSDFDLLMLFRGGVLNEFYATDIGGYRVEVEFSDFAGFESIARSPTAYSLTGPLHLAKIAQAKLIWGDGSQWKIWSYNLLRTSLAEGRCYWLLSTLGLNLLPSKFIARREEYMTALRLILATANCLDFVQDMGLLAAFELRSFAAHAALVLDTERPGWQEKTQAGQNVFPNQGLEVWTALHWLLRNS